MEVKVMLSHTLQKVRAFPPENISRRLYWRFLDSRHYEILFKWKVRFMTRAVMKKAFMDSTEYQSYVSSQIRRSFFTTRKVTTGPPLERTVNLVRLMESALPKSRNELTIVCVGCRNARELDYIEKTCRTKAVGLDLFSVEPRIKVGDMHKMPFGDNQFDCVYSCHSLEHSYDIRAALKEFVRVTKPGGLIVIEVPVNYQGLPSDGDLWDVGSAAKLIEYLGNSVDTVLVQEEGVRDVNGLRKEEARVLVRIMK
jgi:SAM-dependent methyltransferase